MIPGLDIILGGVTGLIGNAFTTWFKYKNAKMEYDHDEKMVGLKTSAMIQEFQMKIQITKAQVEGEIEKADAVAYTKSQEAGSKTLLHERWIDMIMEAGKGKWYEWFFKSIGSLIAFCFAVVDWFNAAMRPALTIYLLGGSTYITYLAWDILDKAGPPVITTTQALVIFQNVTSTMIYLAVSAVTWWFGDRTMSKFLQQQGAKQNRPRPNGNPNNPVVPKGPGGGNVDF